MNYLKLEVKISEHYQEYLIAELLDFDFYGFEQHDDILVAYVEKPRFNDSNRELIEQMVGAIPGAEWVRFSDLEEKNWNETWEASIRPQTIGHFFVRPTWSSDEPAEGQKLLEIDPKMSFGTGYHATTRLMLRQLSEMDCSGFSVLDAGTGTGILAIAAVKQGAGRAVAFDYDPWCEQNATENALINNVEDKVDVRLGGIETAEHEEPFDLVVANINRNVILEYLDRMVGLLKNGGTLLLSGLLQTDERELRSALDSFAVEVQDLKNEDEWMMLKIQKRG